MMHVDYDLYEAICGLLLEGGEENPTYSIEEIAEMVNTSVEVVKYVDRAENDVM